MSHPLKKILFMFSLLLTLHNFSFSQIAPMPPLGQTNQATNVSPNTGTAEINQQHKTILDQFLNQNNYHSFFSYLKENINKNSKSYLNYLLSQKNSNHVPIYWLLADFYARNNQAEETHTWFYTAMIMTQQDASVCSNRTARSASHQLLRSFPDILTVLNRTPQYINPSMQKAMFFIQNIRVRKHPGWACLYASQTSIATHNPLIAPSMWSKRMMDTFRELTQNHSN